MAEINIQWQLTPILCTGRDGIERTFWYSVERDEIRPLDVITFRVHRSNPPLPIEDHWFEMSLEKCPEGVFGITWIGDTEHRPHFKAMGIPDALIPEACRLLRVRIRSSLVRNNEGTNDYRTVDAEKMWKRLACKGLARHDPESLIYSCPAQ